MTTDTPRTDLHVLFDNYTSATRRPILVEGADVVTAAFARELERENAELRAANTTGAERLRFVLEQNARLRSVLKELVAQCRAGGDEICPWWRAAVDNAEAALKYELPNPQAEPRGVKAYCACIGDIAARHEALREALEIIAREGGPHSRDIATAALDADDHHNSTQ